MRRPEIGARPEIGEADLARDGEAGPDLARHGEAGPDLARDGEAGPDPGRVDR
jgi:hypothetical protein